MFDTLRWICNGGLSRLVGILEAHQKWHEENEALIRAMSVDINQLRDKLAEIQKPSEQAPWRSGRPLPGFARAERPRQNPQGGNAA